jgi:predicted transcriptional regulator
MKIQKRDKMKIYGDILQILLIESGNEKIILTRIQLKINMPFIRMKKYFLDLKELGLIEDEISLKVTEKGLQYLHEYEAVLSFMKRMGIGYKSTSIQA